MIQEKLELAKISLADQNKLVKIRLNSFEEKSKV